MESFEVTGLIDLRKASGYKDTTISQLYVHLIRTSPFIFIQGTSTYGLLIYDPQSCSLIHRLVMRRIYILLVQDTVNITVCVCPFRECAEIYQLDLISNLIRPIRFIIRPKLFHGHTWYSFSMLHVLPSIL